MDIININELISQAPLLLVLSPFLVYTVIKIRNHDTNDTRLETKVDKLTEMFVEYISNKNKEGE